jgi:hypothetical protein
VPITTYRPDSTRVQGSWTNQAGSATLHTVVADDSDATYIKAAIGQPNQGNSCRLTVPDTLVLAAGQRVLRARIRIRCGHNGSATQTQTVGAAFYNEGTGSTGLPLDYFFAYPPSSTIRTLTGVWRPHDPEGREWGQQMARDIQVRLYGYYTHSGLAEFERVHEVFADFDIRDRPTVSAVTVTGTTTSSRPLVAWAYNANADGDSQVAWQLKVFSAAQYGAAGFNPSTSAAAWDSGQVAGGLTSVTTGADLVNGVTYKAYIRAAQDFNGARWFSDWALSSSFVAGFEPLPQPALSVVADNTVPHLRNQLTVDAKLNLLSGDDASFETGIGTWATGGNCALSASTTVVAAKGAQSMRARSAAAGNMWANSGLYPAGPSRAYTALGSWRAGVSARSPRVALLFYAGDQTTLLSQVDGGNVTDGTGGWAQATVAATSPAGTQYVRVQGLVLGTAAANEDHYLDAVSLSTSTSTTWFAGGVTDIDAQLVEFADLTPQHSVIVNLLTPQLASGGEHLGDASGFIVRSAKDLVSFDRSQQVDGEGSARWDVGNAAGSLLDVGTALGAYTPDYAAPCVPGTAYTFSAWVRAAAGTHSLRLVATSVDQTGAVAGSATNGATNATIAQSWQRLTVTHTAQAGAVALRLSLDNVNGDLASYFLDALQLEEGSAATAWHQGQGQAPAWQPVRGALTGLHADPRSNLAVCYDREAPPGVIRLYRATNVATYADGSMGVGPVSLYVATKLALPAGNVSILKDPANPAHDLVVSVRSMSHSIAEDASELHPVRPDVPGAEGFGQAPVVISDWVGGHDGTMELNVSDEAVWYRIKQLLAAKRTLLLQMGEGGQRYLRCKERGWSMERIAGDGAAQVPSQYLRVVSVGFTAMRRPTVLT